MFLAMPGNRRLIREGVAGSHARIAKTNLLQKLPPSIERWRLDL